ncbi:MAG: lysophospholipid acyltransferase family protein [Tepidiformaceae bacterium]
MSKLRAARLARPLVGRFPQFFYRLSPLAGWLAYHLRPAVRRNVVRNMLPLCDGDLRLAKREARQACQHVAQYWVDLASLPRRKMGRFEAERITLVHGERLALLEAPGPVVAVSAHMGNVELVIQALTYRGRDFIALVEAQKPPEWSHYLLELRSSTGGNFHEAGFGGLRSSLSALNHGQLVGLMGDRDIQQTGHCVELAGRKVKLPRGPWELARRSGAVLLPVFCSRTRRDFFDVYVEEPFCVARSEDPEADVRAAAERYARLLEAHLRRDPGQWAVLEDFWKAHACRDSDSQPESGHPSG